MRAQATPEGIRITPVGLWYVLFTVVVAVAASNTGNNALYMVLAAMLAVLAVSGIASRQNVRGLAIDLDPPAELHANQPARFGFAVHNRGRLLPRWALLFNLSAAGRPRLVPHLPRGRASRGSIELILPRRGHHPLPAAHVASLFPFGLFRKGARYRGAGRLLVFPELYSAATAQPDAAGDFGETASRRAGWGHELHALRAFRHGDDPRRVHWKQTARTGGLIFMERESEENRRLSILVDNGVGELGAEAAQRFERLVSEAATAAADALARGYEVELVTRGRRLAFAAGRRQRYAVLEALALLEPAPAAAPASSASPALRTPLVAGDPRARVLRLALPEAALPEAVG